LKHEAVLTIYIKYYLFLCCAFVGVDNKKLYSRVCVDVYSVMIR